MVGASGLIEALKRDNLDQRAVAEHLMLLAKVRIRDYDWTCGAIEQICGMLYVSDADFIRNFVPVGYHVLLLFEPLFLIHAAVFNSHLPSRQPPTASNPSRAHAHLMA